jgi:hypothetical protein
MDKESNSAKKPDDGKLQPERPKPKDFWDKLQTVSVLSSGVIVAIVGFFLTGSVNTAIQKKGLELSSAKEMRELVMTLSKAKNREEAETAAITLAAFGQFAIPPVVGILQGAGGGSVQMLAAEKGLQTIGVVEPDAVCGALAQIVKNRTRLFAWDAHGAAIRLLGNLNCRKSLPDLRDYNQLVQQASKPEGLKKYQGIVREDNALADGLPLDLKSDLAQTIKILENACQ